MKSSPLSISLFFMLMLLMRLNVYAQNANDLQPFSFRIKALVQTLDYLGEPISAADQTTINKAIEKNDTAAFGAINNVLGKYCLFDIQINPESRVKVTKGLAKPDLLQDGWRTFLIKVTNQAGITANLEAASPQAQRDYDGGEKIYGMAGMNMGTTVTKQDIADRWLAMQRYTDAPMQSALSGMETDYFIIQLYSRDAGNRAAKFSFNCGQGTQDVGFNSETSLLFNCVPAHHIRLNVLDENNQPATASFIIKDAQNHIYPSQAKRLAPDFFFQPQVYRADGETIDLPAGNYSIEYGRGPEYLSKTIAFKVTDAANQSLGIHLERWIDPSKYGWYSGDHHIHAAGCAHYTSPTQGVNPADMMRHILGEDLNVGSVLTWGPGYDYQKEFFEGKDNTLSTANNLMRYDLEISGFPSSHAGHLVLLRLKDQNYPGAKVIEDWPTWTIPVLKWAKAQGAITGYAHSGLGLAVTTDSLPNYQIPRFDGIGANEYIVAVTQNLVDFISTEDTPPTWELNIWYHTLNCGFRTRIGGETDFPCMSDEVIGHGRSYVKLDGKLNFDDYTEGLKNGRAYVSEGKSHLMNFAVNGTEAGTHNSQVDLAQPATVQITAKIAAMLSENPDEKMGKLRLDNTIWQQKPFWNIERARIVHTRTVPVELIVNGKVAAKQILLADGKVNDVTFRTPIAKSSWVALRIMYSSHTNPIFVIVDNKSIRASAASAAWCLKAVDQCWSQKSPKFSAADKKDAAQVYEQARVIYRKILAESK
jgi:hypothetical protein